MIWRALLSLAALLGFWGGAALSLHHLVAGDVCPTLASVPACYLVSAGYALIFAAAWSPRRASFVLFFAGFLPVFLLAIVGVTLELTQGNICPRALGFIPQCFLSLALASITVALFWRLRGARRRTSPA